MQRTHGLKSWGLLFLLSTPGFGSSATPFSLFCVGTTPSHTLGPHLAVPTGPMVPGWEPVTPMGKYVCAFGSVTCSTASSAPLIPPTCMTLLSWTICSLYRDESDL